VKLRDIKERERERGPIFLAFILST